MPKRIYVGNLPYTHTETDVQSLFEEYGSVTSVTLINDRETGRPRGFGFVEMEDGADEAIAALDGQSIGGRNVKINEARPRDGGGGGGHRGGGGGGHRGGGGGGYRGGGGDGHRGGGRDW